MSSPQSEAIARLVQRVLDSTPDLSTVELGASLGVDSSYITKLRQGWRPSRMRPEILRRFEQFDPSSPAARTQPAAFYDGVLFAAQAMSETVTKLISEARAGLARPSPAEANALADRARAALEAVAASEAAKAARARRRA